MNKKKVGATALTLGVAAAVLLTGTYAYQSLNQEATNEASGIVNPGGRLHDDFNYDEDIKRIYVENFGEQNIYARIKLSEYMELGTGAGVDLTSTEARNVEVITTDADYNDKSTWQIHYYDTDNKTDAYMVLNYGGEAVAYLPTFNMNKDSLQADVNGTYAQSYADYISYDNKIGEEIEGTEVKDNDTNTIEEENPTEENVTETTANHTVSTTLASCVISMKEYTALDDTAKGTTACWVYDEDGWAYWSQPIAEGTATGTLINDIDVQNVDDNWFYALNATAQFITADDLGRNDGTGFYDLEKGTAPTTEALELLEFIGVDTTEEKEDGLEILTSGNTFYEENNYLNADNNTIQITAVEYANNQATNSAIEYTINPAITGVSISDTGLLTVNADELTSSTPFVITVEISSDSYSSGLDLYYGAVIEELTLSWLDDVDTYADKGQSYVLNFSDYTDNENAETNTVTVFGTYTGLDDELLPDYDDDITATYYDATTNVLTIPADSMYQAIEVKFNFMDYNEEGNESETNAYYMIYLN